VNEGEPMSVADDHWRAAAGSLANTSSSTRAYRVVNATDRSRSALAGRPKLDAAGPSAEGRA
jgi:hypothetical protein